MLCLRAIPASIYEAVPLRQRIGVFKWNGLGPEPRHGGMSADLSDCGAHRNQVLF